MVENKDMKERSSKFQAVPEDFVFLDEENKSEDE